MDVLTGGTPMTKRKPPYSSGVHLRGVFVRRSDTTTGHWMNAVTGGGADSGALQRRSLGMRTGADSRALAKHGQLRAK